MTRTTQRLSTGLTYAGALPFWLLLIAPATVFGTGSLEMFLSYGAVIAAFMAGTLWGFAQMGRGELAIVIASNVLALLAFATLLTPSPMLAFSLQLVVFAVLYAADATLLAGDAERRWYLTLRQRITLLVGAAYIAMLVKVVAYA